MENNVVYYTSAEKQYLFNKCPIFKHILQLYKSKKLPLAIQEGSIEKILLNAQVA